MPATLSYIRREMCDKQFERAHNLKSSTGLIVLFLNPMQDERLKMEEEKMSKLYIYIYIHTHIYIVFVK